MNCDSCTHRPDPVPFAVHESAMARMERTIRRLWILLILLVVLLVGSNALWIWYESQFEDVTTETNSFVIEQDATDGGSNIGYAIGGDFHGETKNQGNEDADTDQDP